MSDGFDLSAALPEGVTVLEASAGTGKTFTIAALATRFVADGTPLEQLLLVTFTRAATGELRERVRERLVGTERALADSLAGAPSDDTDPVVSLLTGGTPDEVESRRERLADAIANFDAATIETTHGFCQRVLDDLGTLGDLEPDVTFVENVDDLVEEVVDDLYVRRFHRVRGETGLSRQEAGQIARLAIANPGAPIHPTAAAEDSAPAMRARLAHRVQEELERRKRSLALMTHDDQLTRLCATLTGPNGPEAAAMLRRRYRVVLIDEFQDTDPIQWEIVRRAFDGDGVRLVLIGDPKQAIYAFRGADVYAYLEAASQAGRRATLDTNHRSDQGLLDGLDALFGNARLGHPGIVYRRVRATPANRSPRLDGAPHSSPLRVRLVDSAHPEIGRTRGGWASAPSVREFVARDLSADVVTLLSSEARVTRRGSSGGSQPEPVAPGDIAVLVYSHRQARQIQDQLHESGVPAVINGSGSVFATPAADDWRTILEALERPTSPPRARAAAITPLLGWSAEELAGAGEDQLEALHQRLYRWARVLREQGVAAMTRSILVGQDTPQRLLRRPDGERYLTDLQHVSQLLHATAGAQQLGMAALTGWLRQRIAAVRREGGNDELTRRLDSDADAVQVLTFHRSKGLEFPIVYCPFLWEPEPLSRENEPVYFHDSENGDHRSIDVGLEGREYREHYRQHCMEERGEELRHAYVALTRARHQAVVWWSSTWNSRDSPLGRLLFARDEAGNVAWSGSTRPSDESALERFTEIRHQAPHAVSVEPAVMSGLPQRWAGRLEPEEELSVARFARRLDTAWRRTSYSAITAAAHESLVGSEPEETVILDEPAGADEIGALTVHSGEVHETAGEPELPLAPMATGPKVGTAVHRALELVDFTTPDLSGAVTEALQAATAGSPNLLGCPTATVADGIVRALRTPLGGSLGAMTLAHAVRGDRLDELQFELPLAGGERPTGHVSLHSVATLLDEWLEAGDPLRDYAARLHDPTLAGALRGYLTGTIDLVLRVGAAGPEEASLFPSRARFHVVDYKTNWLAPPDQQLSAWHYRPAALAAEMQRSHYVLQALFYTVALHRFLRWRVAGYEPETDLGGVHYLFVRGMLGEAAPDTPEGRHGVFSWHPPAGLVVALSEVLDGA